MKFPRFFSIFTLFFFAASFSYSLGKKDKENESEQSSKQEKTEVQNDFIKIDMLLDSKSPNPKNYLKWKNSSASYDDYFDTISGASKVHSTKYLREVTLDSSTKSLKIPKGLRSLCLFSVANPESLKNDNFLITQQGKKLTITFSHRQIDYKIESDEEGFLNVPDGFFIKLPPKAEENAKAEKSEEKPKTEEKTAAMPESEKKSEDINKDTEKAENTEITEKTEPEPSDGFQKDIPPSSIAAIYEGKLKANLSPEGIFTLTGKIKQKQLVIRNVQ
ncbi:hypothetical protein [uncultured Treponema sp.]|uniref:hypothetical protein n=1 Tax=uncultured Treponema sp. TaxID=162155 RepID=UPI0025D9ED1A|nr:hypothetical protein [uncultured Treponema sp.]